MRPPSPPATRTGGRATLPRSPIVLASLGLVVAVVLTCALVYSWANDHGRADGNRDVAALGVLVSAMLGIDNQGDSTDLSFGGRTELERAIALARADGSASAVRLVARDGTVIYSSGDEFGAGVLSAIPLGDPTAPVALLEIERPDDAAGSGGVAKYLLIAALLLWLAAVPVASRVIRGMSSGGRRRRRVVREIQSGIDGGEFELHYQPQLDIVSGRPVAVEALLRWRREGQLVAPGEFLSDAEACGAIVPLTDHVVELAFAQAAALRAAGHELRVSINLSAANLRDFRIVEHLKRLLERFDVPTSSITFEVTETAVLDEPEQTRGVLDALAELGFPISVDDFGTGYSSLLWLRLFPVTEVKIDRSFVGSMGAEGEAYVAGVIRLGHDLDLTVVAEGIEDRETLIALQELGCDVGQGFLFAKALPAEELEAWLAAVDPDEWATERKELSMLNDAVDLEAARRLIEQTAGHLGFDNSAIWDMKCAATEALTNALEHGSPSPDGMIHLRLGRDHGDMLVEVWGGGKANGTPHVDATHRGRGIAIMTALMDDVEMRRNNGDTIVRLVKRLPTVT
jgi:EAL domain-containing protein (putative c-di-GMP-specific phosphodiesterase class I)/anti-sigma regulatory factor (Ser/Thr protein kinase)